MDAGSNVDKSSHTGQKFRLTAVPRNCRLLTNGTHIRNTDGNLRAIPGHTGRVDTKFGQVRLSKLAIDGNLQSVNRNLKDSPASGFDIDSPGRMKLFGQKNRVAGSRACDF